MSMTQQQAAPLPGQFFEVPGAPGGETQWLDEYEPTQGLSVTLSSSSQVGALGIQQFKQTDVVLDWELELAMTQAYTAGTGQTITSSEYAPHNALGPVKITIQNQYSSVDVESGIDLYIFNLIRPERNGFGGGGRSLLGFNPAGFQAGSTALGYPAAGNAQANLVAPAQWVNSGGTYNLFYRLPASQWFDIYYDRAITGEPVSPPHAAVVSPQYMAGTTRVIIPSVKFNPGYGATLDQGPVFTTALTPTTDTASTFTGSSVMSFRRKGVYAGAAAVLPPVYAWQYRWKTDRFGIGGLSKYTLQVPLDSGQVLALYVRMYDPAASSAKGAAIALSAVSSISLQYGSGLNRWTGTPTELQEMWLRQHGLLLPPGVFAFDLALDERGLITNKRVLNTLTTAGIQVVINFSGAQSSTSYVVLGTESLVYVT